MNGRVGRVEEGGWDIAMAQRYGVGERDGCEWDGWSVCVCVCLRPRRGSIRPAGRETRFTSIRGVVGGNSDRGPLPIGDDGHDIGLARPQIHESSGTGSDMMR